jgi:hypothetical protein
VLDRVGEQLAEGDLRALDVGVLLGVPPKVSPKLLSQRRQRIAVTRVEEPVH